MRGDFMKQRFLLLALGAFLLLTASLATAEETVESARLLFYPNGDSTQFLARIVQFRTSDDYWYYYRARPVSIIGALPGEWVSSYVNSTWSDNRVTYEIFAWGRLKGNQTDFDGRFEFVADKKKKTISFDVVAKSPLARLIYACAETGKSLLAIPAYKKWAKVSESEMQTWEPLLKHLGQVEQPWSPNRGRNLDLYSIFTGISAIRETLQTDANLTSGQPPVDRACQANQRVIQGAVEMYNMDHQTMMDTLDLDVLVKDGYLKTRPACRSGKEYYGKNLSGNGMIRCPVHGDIENPTPDKGNEGDSNEPVQVSTIEGPKAPSHPWRKMIKNPDLKLPEVYGMIPADCAFIHFPSYTAFRKAFDFFADWAAALGTIAGGDSGGSDFGLEERIKDQLLLKTDMLTRLFADLALSDIVFVAADPFLFEGSAFAVLLKITNEAMLREKLAMTVAEFREQNPAITDSNVMLGGRQVQAFTSPDFRFRSYRLVADGYQVICNSPLLMEKIIAVLDKKSPALTEFLDLHYFYEHIEKNFQQPGRIFSFLSDAFIRKLIGPAYKIATKRRLDCIRNMLLQTHELMVNDGSLNPEIRCSEGGNYEAAGDRISCSLHRSFGCMTPVSERLPVEVTRDEANGYAAFVAQYNQYFTQFFDPIGFVFTTEPDFCGRLLIMPLVENGIYSELQKNVRHEAMKPGPQLKTGIAKVGANLKAETLPVPAHYYGSPQNEKRIELLRRWFTGCIWAHLADHPLLFHWDSNLLARGILGALGGGRGNEFMALTPAVLSFFSPVLFALELTDQSHYEAIISWLQSEIAAARGWGGFMSPSFRLERLEENGMSIYVFSFDLFAVRKTYYLTCRDSFLLIASKKELFFELEEPSETEKNAFSGNFNFVLYPAKICRMRPDLLELRARSQREACLENLRNLHFIAAFHPEQVERYYRMIYSAAPACPGHGSYSTEIPASCSMHGSIADGVLKPVADFFAGVGAVSVQTFIDPEGLQSEIRFISE